MLLAVALRWATSHRITAEHADRYRSHLLSYLHVIRQMCPAQDLRPNHHEAIHLADLLLHCGPVHGWWMFPFERVIGMLQHVNTNNKLGAYKSPCSFAVLT